MMTFNEFDERAHAILEQLRDLAKEFNGTNKIVLHVDDMEKDISSIGWDKEGGDCRVVIYATAKDTEYTSKFNKQKPDKKAVRNLYLLVKDPNVKTPATDAKGRLIVVTADTHEDAVKLIEWSTGRTIPPELVVDCNIHHGRSALYLYRR